MIKDRNSKQFKNDDLSLSLSFPIKDITVALENKISSFNIRCNIYIEIDNKSVIKVFANGLTH